jgi:hypothetical protein
LHSKYFKPTAAVMPGDGVSAQAGHPGLDVVALGDESGDAPADASQRSPCARLDVVVHGSSLVSGYLIAGHY